MVRIGKCFSFMLKNGRFVSIKVHRIADILRWERMWTRFSALYGSLGLQNSCQIICYPDYFELVNYFVILCFILFSIWVIAILGSCGNFYHCQFLYFTRELMSFFLCLHPYHSFIDILRESECFWRNCEFPRGPQRPPCYPSDEAGGLGASSQLY